MGKKDTEPTEEGDSLNLIRVSNWRKINSFLKAILIVFSFYIVVFLVKWQMVCVKKDPIGAILGYVFLIIPSYIIIFLKFYYSRSKLIYLKYRDLYQYWIVLISLAILLGLSFLIMKFKLFIFLYSWTPPYCYVPLAP